MSRIASLLEPPKQETFVVDHMTRGKQFFRFVFCDFGDLVACTGDYAKVRFEGFDWFDAAEVNRQARNLLRRHGREDEFDSNS